MKHKFFFGSILAAVFVFCASVHCAAAIHHRFAVDSPTVVADKDTDDAKSADANHSRYIDVSMEYGSNFTYRHQIGPTPTAAPYLYPMIYYHDKTGLWASVAAYRLINTYYQTQNDGTQLAIAPTWIEGDLNVGWDFKLGPKNDASVSYLYSRFDRNIELVREAPGNTFEGYFGHDFTLIYTGLRGDYTYENFIGTLHGKQVNVPVTDYYASWETYRDFYIDKPFSHNDYFELSPMFTLLAGTDNFIGKFIVARYPSSRQAQNYANIASQFLIQEFILDAPVAYNIGDLTATATFEYTLLTQKATETAPTTFPVYKFSLAYRFNFK